MKDKKYIGKITEFKGKDGIVFCCQVYEIKKKE